MSDYILKNIDPELWRKVKIKTAIEGKTVKQVLLDALKRYANPKKHQKEMTE